MKFNYVKFLALGVLVVLAYFFVTFTTEELFSLKSDISELEDRIQQLEVKNEEINSSYNQLQERLELNESLIQSLNDTVYKFDSLLSEIVSQPIESESEIIEEPVEEYVEQEPITEQYIGNANSYKFHRTTCSYLPAEYNRIYFSSREEAIAAGMEPCKRCNP